jgi:putative ABC transport system permease protein
MPSLDQDLRYALRQLRRAPAFALTAVLLLAVGIGANVALFTIFDQVWLRPLPVAQPQSLVRLSFTGEDSGSRHSFGGGTGDYFSYPIYRDLRDRNSVFSGLLAEEELRTGIVWSGVPELVDGELVSTNYFDVLGVRPALGRLLISSDDEAPVAVLSYDYWVTRFNRSAAVLGKSLLVNGQPVEIAGVTQPGFASAISDYKPRVFFPLTLRPVLQQPSSAAQRDAKTGATPDDLHNRRSRWLVMVGRLKPGVTPVAARAALQPLWHSLRAAELQQMGHSSAHFIQRFLTDSTLELTADTTGFAPSREDLAKPLSVLLGMVLLLALMTCANLAGLLLVRAAARDKEIAVRYALGAGRSRILRQLLVEGAVLGLGGGVLGLAAAPAFAAWLLGRLLGAGVDRTPFSTHPNLSVVLFTLTLSLVVSLLFSAAPAWQLARAKLEAMSDALRNKAGQTHGAALGFRRAAVLLQIALSVVLLSGAALLVRTLHNLRSQPLGLSTDHLVTLRIDPFDAGHGAAGEAERVHASIRQALIAVPGVEAAGGTVHPDLHDSDGSENITVEGHPYVPDHEIEVGTSTMTPGYFAALRIPLVAGRDFSDSDTAVAPKVAVVNETFARTYFGSASAALGHRLAEGSGDVKLDTRIVGVVRDAKHELRNSVIPSVYWADAQQSEFPRLYYYVRTRQLPEAAESSIRAAVRRVDPNLVVDPMHTMDEQIDQTLANERTLATFAASFAALALLTTGVGIYSVLAYATAQRTREIGIRMALGALPGAVVRLVLRDTLALAVVAVLAALPVSVAAARLLASQLFGVSAFDPATLALCAVLPAIVVALAAAGPAWRAASVDPNQALRSE